MVAYSFQPEFEEPIRLGTKRQTLRNVGRRHHGKPGDELQLYVRQRHPSGYRLGVATCLGRSAIVLDFKHGRIEYPETGRALTQIDELDAFAMVDGFAHWKALRAFWAKHHPEVTDRWQGYRIWWGETFRRDP